jgi:hypothetical protein
MSFKAEPMRLLTIRKLPAPLPGAPAVGTLGIRTAHRKARSYKDVATRQPAPRVCRDCNGTSSINGRIYAVHLKARSTGVPSAPVRHLCATCASAYYLCNVCGKWHHGGNVSKYVVPAKVRGVRGVTKVAVCGNCFGRLYFQCSECGDTYAREAMVVHEGRGYCASCRENPAVFPPCSECGEVHHRAFMTMPNSTTFLCAGCRQVDVPVVQAYSHRPKPIFFSTSPTKGPKSQKEDPRELYMGVELEIDDGRRGRAVSKDLASREYLYLKHDGSLSNIGIEIVTHPATLEAHNTLYQWPTILELCRSNGWKSFDANRSCGLHVHVNRAFLDPRFGDRECLDACGYDTASSALLRLTSFVYGHNPEYTAMAQRSSEQYARMSSVRKPQDLKVLKRELILKAEAGCFNRYQALNFNNAHTVEWRLFRGTLNDEAFMATLELVDATCRYVKQSGIAQLFKIKQSWIEFCDFVQTYEKGRYTNLIKYMKGKGIWNATHG